MSVFRTMARIVLPLLVLGAASAVAVVTVNSREETERRPPPEPALTEVDVLAVAPRDFEVTVTSRGTVRPRTESTLIPEIAGRVVETSPRFRTGEFFEAGDVLLRIDERDYRAAATVAEAELAQARGALAEEEARAAQARRDWERIGSGGEPDALVVRKPQLSGARAAVASAGARLERARLNLERTVIRAPYAGRVLEQNVDVGQYVSPGTVLARVYAVDYAEVRLPLTDRQLQYVDVPEIFRGDAPGERFMGTDVILSARVGTRVHEWQGRLVRAEGAIDTASRQLFVVVQVDDPYGKGPPGRPPLKVGQFVEARIAGRTLEGVFVVPRAALRAGGEVLVVDAGERLRTRRVEVLWSDEHEVVTGEGLSAGDRVVTTPLGGGMEGVAVRIAGAPGPTGERRGSGKRAS